ncbi:MAG: hypothetical protein HKM04_01160 [Legionellales bacterium]|nr:hypothetical protein [Legionellales bacterium]
MSLLNTTPTRPLMTEAELAFMFSGSDDSRYSKIKRLVAQGKLLRIRRGLYTWARDSKPKVALHSFELAQRIYAPSYVSLESALAYHQLIPEAVYTVTSVSTKRSKEFDTPLGKFSYTRLPTHNFYVNVKLVVVDNHQFFMAKPWKAICDYVYCYKKNWRSLEPLQKSLRIDIDELSLLGDSVMTQLEHYYHSERITRFLCGIKRELKL